MRVERRLAIGIQTEPEGQEAFSEASAFVLKLKPVLILMYGPSAAALNVPGRLVEPGQSQSQSADVPRFPIRTDAFRAALEKLPTGDTKMRATMRLSDPIHQTIKLRNIAGVLRGSDPQLKDSYVVVSANYEGFPTRRFGADTIFNGANTNASGVAAMLETAKALASGKPKRSILFVAASGETPDGAGSKHYREHPLVPIGKTIACINLMQLGRTDSTDGPKLGSAAITGFKRDGIPASFATAGAPTGVTFYEDKAQDAEDGPGRGFKPIFLDKGVPSHTIYVAFSHPEVRRMSDEAGKLDYDNMAKVTRGIVAGLLSIAK